MLRPLDRRKLDALAVPDNDAECDSIRRTKAYLAKEKDLARGVMCLFEGWDVFEPRIHHDREAENKWQIKFRVCVLVSYIDVSGTNCLRILPSIVFE